MDMQHNQARQPQTTLNSFIEIVKLQIFSSCMQGEFDANSSRCTPIIRLNSDAQSKYRVHKDFSEKNQPKN